MSTPVHPARAKLLKGAHRDGVRALTISTRETTSCHALMFTPRRSTNHADSLLSAIVVKRPPSSLACNDEVTLDSTTRSTNHLLSSSPLPRARRRHGGIRVSLDNTVAQHKSNHTCPNSCKRWREEAAGLPGIRRRPRQMSQEETRQDKPRRDKEINVRNSVANEAAPWSHSHRSRSRLAHDPQGC